MKNIKLYSLLSCILVLVIACSEMNDIHDEYIKDGEIIYIGKVDSARILAGKERFLLRYWISDPKAKILKVFWLPNKDSVIIHVPEHEPVDSIDQIVGDIKKPIPEGNYTFQLVTTDGGDLRSIKYEKNGNVYGNNFQATLSNRLVKQAELSTDGASLTIDWGGITSSKEAGIEITYFNLDNEQITVLLPAEQVGTQTILENADVGKKISYRTLFIPEPLAIDSFYTEPEFLTVQQTINVALNKSAVASDLYNDSFTAEKAVDGMLTNESRWVSTADVEHWLEINLGKEYAINSFKTWTGTSGNFTQPTKNFSLQAEVNGVWVDVVTVTNNTNPQYGSSFPEITTSKVRYFVPAYTGNQVRLYEIAVYSTIEF